MAFWQTYAWSRGKRSAYTNIYQNKSDVKKCGVSLHLNESYGGEGIWNTKPAAVPVPEKQPASTEIVPGKLVTIDQLIDSQLEV